ncbi:hypothetical protein A2U01_0072427, partial [Trifolium medium]|nr:hypothetical protein [Trifolium medium]
GTTALSIPSGSSLSVAVAAGTRAVVLTTVGALLGGVIRVSWNGGVQCSGRASVVHFCQARFFQGEHGASLKKCWQGVALANQRGNST